MRNNTMTTVDMTGEAILGAVMALPFVLAALWLPASDHYCPHKGVVVPSLEAPYYTCERD